MHVVFAINRGYSNVFVKYVFYFTSEVDNIYISRVAKPRMKYNYCPLHE